MGCAMAEPSVWPVKSPRRASAASKAPLQLPQHERIVRTQAFLDQRRRCCIAPKQTSQPPSAAAACRSSHLPPQAVCCCRRLRLRLPLQLRAPSLQNPLTSRRSPRATSG
jgi:hypothetical protein